MHVWSNLEGSCAIEMFVFIMVVNAATWHDCARLEILLLYLKQYMVTVICSIR